MKRTRIKAMSAKKRKEIADTKAIRSEYIKAGLPCEACEVAPASECHEITAGAHRHRAVYEMNAQLYLCPGCHEALQGRPYAEQIRVRIGAMIRAVNRCHGSNVVDAGQVYFELEEWLL